MSQLGIEFESKSFKTFNEQLTKFTQISSKVNNNLDTIAKGLENFLKVADGRKLKSRSAALGLFANEINNFKEAMKRLPNQKRIMNLALMGNAINLFANRLEEFSDTVLGFDIQARGDDLSALAFYITDMGVAVKGLPSKQKISNLVLFGRSVRLFGNGLSDYLKKLGRIKIVSQNRKVAVVLKQITDLQNIIGAMPSKTRINNLLSMGNTLVEFGTNLNIFSKKIRKSELGRIGNRVKVLNQGIDSLNKSIGAIPSNARISRLTSLSSNLEAFGRDLNSFFGSLPKRNFKSLVNRINSISKSLVRINKMMGDVPTDSKSARLGPLGRNLFAFISALSSARGHSIKTPIRDLSRGLRPLFNVIQRAPRPTYINRVNAISLGIVDVTKNLATAFTHMRHIPANFGTLLSSLFWIFNTLPPIPADVVQRIHQFNNLLTPMANALLQFRTFATVTLNTQRLNDNINALGVLMRFFTSNQKVFVGSNNLFRAAANTFKTIRSLFSGVRGNSVIASIARGLNQNRLTVVSVNNFMQAIQRLVNGFQTIAATELNTIQFNQNLTAIAHTVSFFTTKGKRKGIMSLISSNFVDSEVDKLHRVVDSIRIISNSFRDLNGHSATLIENGFHNLNNVIEAIQRFTMQVGVDRPATFMNPFKLIWGNLTQMFGTGTATMRFGGVIKMISQFEKVDIASFQTFAISFRRILLAFTEMVGIGNIDQSQVNNLRNGIQSIIEIFVGHKQNGGLFSFMGGLFGGRAKSSFKGIIEVVSGFAGLKLTNLSNFATSIHSFAEGLVAFTRIEIDPNNIDRAVVAIRRLFEVFAGKGVGIGSRLGGFFRNLSSLNISGALSSIFSKGLMTRMKDIDPENLNNFGLMANAIASFGSGIQSVQNVKIDLNSIKKLGEALTELTKSFTKRGGLFRSDGVLQQMKKFDTKVFENFGIFTKASGQLVSSLEKIANIRGFQGFGKEFRSMVGELVKASREINKELSKEDFSKLNEFSGIINRLVNAMQKQTPKNLTAGIPKQFAEAGGESAERFTEQAEEKWKISSPSRVFERIGGNLAQGLINGIRGGIKALGNIAKGIGQVFAQIINPQVIRRRLQFFTRAWTQMAQRANQATQQMRQRFVVTLGDLVRIGRDVGRQFYQAFIGVGIEFESAFAGVMKTLDTSQIFAEGGQEAVDAFTGSLRTGLKELAADPESLVSGLDNAFVRLSGIAESAGQLGIAGDNILEFTDVVGQLSQATNLADEDASFFLARFGTLTDTDEYDRIGSAIVNLGNNFATTEKEITELTERIVGSANAAGFSQTEILGWSAAMRAVGLEAESAGSNFSMLVGDITSAVSEGGAELTAFANVTGQSVDEFSTLFREDASGAVQSVIRGLAELNNEELYAFFGEAEIDSERMRRMITLLANDTEGLERALRIAEEGYQDAGDSIADYNALQQEAARRAATAQSAIARFANVKRNFADTLGQFFIPTFVTATNAISEFIASIDNWMQSNPEEANAIIKTMGVLIGGLAGTFIATSVGLTTFLNILGGPFTFAFRLAITGVAGFVGLLFNPVGLIAGMFMLAPAIIGATAMLAALGTIFVDVRANSEQISGSFVRLWDNLKLLGESLGNLVNGFFDFTRALFSSGDAAERAYSPIASLLDFISSGVKSITIRATELAHTFGLLAQIGRGEFITGGGPRRNLSPEDQMRFNQLMRERIKLQNDINKAQEEGNEGFLDYTLQYGDTIYDIAQEHGVTVDEILEASDATLQDFMEGRIDIKIPIEVESNEEVRTQLQERLSTIDSELQTFAIESEGINRLSDNELFKKMFGDDDGAIDRARTAWADIQTDADQIKTAVDIMCAGFGEIASGNFQDAFRSFGQAFKEGFGGIGGILGTVLGVASGEYAQDLDAGLPDWGFATEDLIGIDRTPGFIAQLDAQLDFDAIETFLSDNLHHVLIAASALAFGTPLGLAVSLGQLFLDAVEDDFHGMGSIAEDSPILQEILKLRNTISETLSSAFSELFSSQESTSEQMGAIGLPFELVDNNPFANFISELGAGSSEIITNIAALLATILSEAVSKAPEFFSFVWSDLAVPFFEGFISAFFDVDRSEPIGDQIAEVIKRGIALALATLTVFYLGTGAGIFAAFFKAILLGPTIAMNIATSLATSFMAGTKIMAGLAAIKAAIGTALGGLLAAATALAIPAMIAAVFVAIGALIVSEDFRSKVFEMIQNTLGDVLANISGFDSFGEWSDNLEGKIIDFISPFVETVSGVIRTIEDWIGRIASFIEGIKLQIDNIVHQAKLGIHRAIGAIPGVDSPFDSDELRAEGERIDLRFDVRSLDAESSIDELVDTYFKTIQLDEMGLASDVASHLDSAIARINSGEIELSEALDAGILGTNDDFKDAFFNGLNLTPTQVSEYISDILADGFLSLNEQNFAQKISEAGFNPLGDDLLRWDEILTGPANVAIDSELGFGNIASLAASSFANGIEDSEDEIRGAGSAFPTYIREEIETGFEMKSPSRVMMRYGKNIVAGLTTGMKQHLPGVQVVFNAVQSAMLRINNIGIILGNVMSALFTRLTVVATMFGNAFTIKIYEIEEAIAILTSSLQYLGAVVDTMQKGGLTNPAAVLNKATPKAKGGPLGTGRLYEVAENNLPFEMFQFGDRRFMFANQPGMAISPLTSSALGLGNSVSNTSNVNNFDNGVNVTIRIDNINGNVTPEQAQSIGQNIATGFKNNTANTLTDRLNRRGEL